MAQLGHQASKKSMVMPLDMDEDVPFDGSEPGADYDPLEGSRISAVDREAVARFRRSNAELEEVELEPLPGLQKVVTTGKDLHASRKHVFADGLEGMCVSVNPAADTVAVGLRNNSIQLLDLAKLEPMSLLDLSGEGSGTITALHYRPDTASGTKNVALVAQNDQILTLHTSTGQVLSKRKEHKNKINCLALRGSDAALLASAGSDMVVRVYDEATGRPLHYLEHGDDVLTSGHSNAVFSVAWNPDDPQVLVSGGWDRSIKVWDLRVVRSVRSIFGPYICGDALSIRGGRVLTGSWRNSHALQQWDLNTTKLMTNMTFYQPEHEACLIYCAKFGEGQLDGLAFAGGSGKRPCLRTYQTRGEIQGTLPLPSSMVGCAQSSSAATKQRSLLVCCTNQVLCLDL